MGIARVWLGLAVAITLGGTVATGCGGAPPQPKRGVVESDLGSWHFRRFQPVLDVEVWVENNKAEAIIPLDQRGQQFMAGMYQAVSKSVVQQMHTSPHPTMPRGQAQTSIVSYDQSTHVHGNTFELKGDSAKQVMAELKAKDRLAKLTSPVRH